MGNFFFFFFFFFEEEEEEEEGSLVPIELNAHTAECMNPLCSTRGSKGPAKIKHLAEQMKKKICYLTTYIQHFPVSILKLYL